MNLEAEILREHSKRQTMKIVRWVGADTARFKQLMELFLRGEYRVTQRAAWSVNYCAEKHPQLIRPWLKAMIQKMQEPGVHDAVKRNVVRILQFIEIPRRLQGTVAAVCFDFLNTPATPVAIQAFSMTVLARIAEQEPDLRRELKLVIERMMPYSRAAICARGRQILKTLG